MGRFPTGKEERGEFWVKIEVLAARKGTWYLQQVAALVQSCMFEWRNWKMSLQLGREQWTRLKGYLQAWKFLKIY